MSTTPSDIHRPPGDANGPQASGSAGGGVAGGSSGAGGSGMAGSGMPGDTSVGGNAGGSSGSFGGSGSSSGRGNIGGSASADGDSREEAARLARQVAEEGKERVDEYRGAAADTVDRFAQGVKAAASELDEGEGLGQLSGHINDLAGGMARLSQGLREKSADELMRDVNRIARDNPAMFIAGGVALGFTLTRLLRASSQAAGAGPDHGGDTGRTP